MLKHVNSLFWNLDFFYYFKLVFDSNISGLKMEIQGNFLNVNFARRHFFSGSKMEKTVNLSQNWLSVTFFNFDRRRF